MELVALSLCPVAAASGHSDLGVLMKCCAAQPVLL